MTGLLLRYGGLPRCATIPGHRVPGTPPEAYGLCRCGASLANRVLGGNVLRATRQVVKIRSTFGHFSVSAGASIQIGQMPCPAWSVRRQHPRVLTNTEPFLDHFRTIGSRDLLHWLNSDGSSILEVRETTPRWRQQHVSTPGFTQR